MDLRVPKDAGILEHPKWGGGGLGCSHPPTKEKFKKIYFVYMMISKVLRYFSSNLNEPPKSADD